jgi:putative DNA primase/helicase
VHLRDLIGTFPFVDDADRAVALSGILTAVIRRSLPTSPLHGFNAPTAGSGKSMLVDIGSVISAGRLAAVIAQGKTEEEMEKRLGASLLAGDPLISIDNCDSPLGGELLCQALTQPTLKVRILGKSLNAEVPSNAAIYATGNNLTLAGDMTRRALRCSLDPGVERPELRAFDRNPVTTVKENRGQYIAAAITIMRTFYVAGQPQQTTPLGSFEDWSRWVRDALIWLGEADPCATMDKVRGADPKLEALTMVLEQWRAVIGGARVSVKEAIDLAVEQRISAFGRPEFVQPDFREVLLGVAGDGGAISGRRLGKWIAANQNRIVGGFKLVSAGMVAGLARWRLADSDGHTPQTDTNLARSRDDRVIAVLPR